MKKTALFIALVVTLSLNATNTFSRTATNAFLSKQLVNQKVYSSDELNQYIADNFHQTLIRTITVESSEDVIAATAEGKIYYVEVENSIIIDAHEMPNT